MSEQEIKVGDMVRTGVYVCGEWRPSYSGRVVRMSSDGMVAEVDVMSHHGGRPWVRLEATSHLRKLDTPNAELTGRHASGGPFERPVRPWLRSEIVQPY